MPVEMKDVRALLDPDEPDYGAVTTLGDEAMPYLEELAGNDDDPMMASKATYAASLIGGDRATDTVAQAARSDDPIVRVAAAAAASNLSADDASGVLQSLVSDADPGVRKVARSSVPEKASQALTERLRELPEERADAPQPIEPGVVEGLMPGEKADLQRMPGESSGLMPGEEPMDSSAGQESQGEMPT